MPKISADYLRSRLVYDPATGLFTWLPKDPSVPKNRQWNGQFAGALAGCLVSNGYWVITLDYVYQRGHQLAWLYMTGEWPSDEIDHEDRNRANNRWGNLREATTSQNQANSGPQINNTSGFKGVSWSHRHKKWRAQIMVRGDSYFLGFFADKRDAANAYKISSRAHFGKFAL